MAQTPMWAEGLEASRPAFGVESRVFFATDTGRVFLDLGTSWLTTALVHRGAYNGAASYQDKDLVTSAGSVWRALRVVTGVTPAEGADWTLFVSKGDPGIQGPRGFSVLNGSGAPASGTGVDGDYYIDTAAHAIYGPKTAGAWGSATSLIGPPGADGYTVLSGSGAPASGTGKNGDYYIDTAAHAIYGPKTAGAWGSATSLIGPQGPAAYTTTTGFTQPAVGSTVSAIFGNTGWMVATEVVYVAGGGSYSVTSVTDATHAVLTNLGYAGNAAAGATIAGGAAVVPSGQQGIQGPAGPINTIQVNGSAFTQRSAVNFINASGADNAGAGRTDVTIPAIATQAQADAGTDDATIVTPLKLATTPMGLLNVSRTEVSVTGAATLTSTAFGKMHVLSGTTADYTVVFPAASGNAGKVIALRGATGLTKTVTINTSGAAFLSAVIAGEGLWLESDGTTWVVVAGSPRKPRHAMTPYRSSTDLANGAALSGGVWTNLGPQHTFVLLSPVSQVAVTYGGGVTLFSSVAHAGYSQVLVDGTAYTLGGGFGAANNYATPMAGAQPIWFNASLAAGSHTLQLQIKDGAAASLYARAATEPAEAIYATVVEFR